MLVMDYMGGFQVVLQTRISLLRGRKIAGLQSVSQIFVIRVRLAVLAKELAGRVLQTRLRTGLQGLLQCRQCILGRRDVARLQGPSDHFDSFDNLAKTAWSRRLARLSGRIYTGDAAHIRV